MLSKTKPETSTKSPLRKGYLTDLTDAQWERISSFIPLAKSNRVKGGRPRTTNMREVVNAIFYFVRSGCEWRMLPHDFPDWHIVRHYFDAWQNDGTWLAIHDSLRRQVRLSVGNKEQPTAAI